MRSSELSCWRKSPTTRPAMADLIAAEKARAWKVWVRGWGEEPQALTIATSRGKAIARNLASANEVGYKLTFLDFWAMRATDFDAWIERYGMFSWSWEYAQKMLLDPVDR